MRANASKDLAQSRGTLYLEEWTRLFSAVVSNPEFHVDSANKIVRCKVFVPARGVLEAEAPTVESVTTLIMSEVQRVLLEPASLEQWPQEWRRAAASVCISKTDAAPERLKQSSISSSGASKERLYTKDRQETIGVNARSSLKEAIEKLAGEGNTTVSEVARNLLTEGFESYEKRSYTESPSKLITNFQSHLDSFSEGEPMQWMVRVKPQLFIRIKLAAKQHGKSVSQIAASCLAYSYLSQEYSLAFEKVNQCTGPKARELAKDIGIGSHVSLLNGILVGRIAPPAKILSALAARLNISASALANAFSENFRAATVPAYKAESGKPELSVQPSSWEAAVRNLKIPDEEVARLLNFKD